jgi:murein DD-endopeptidase MepM/ murein hydrolase activator NlpD
LVSATSPTAKTRIRAALATLLIAAAPAAPAQRLFKYQDANGTWVFTDRQPDTEQRYEAQTIERSFEQPEVRLFERTGSSGDIALVAQNTFYAPIQLAFRLTQMENVAASTPRDGFKVLPPRSETQLLVMRRAQPNVEMRINYDFQFLPGEPGAEHRPEQPYRLPYALASSVRVSQAYPDTITHGDQSATQAIDFVMPIGTNVFAAREGVVIEVASDFFENGTNMNADGPRANVVRVLHSDGTMSVYGHLNWNSIRVKPGQRVARGEYLADSGNTGFSTGPHLHFVVQRNKGGALESVPVEFVGVGGMPMTVHTGERPTAY